MHDLFISYAHANDEPPLDEKNGWVTTLSIELKKRLRGIVGGEGPSVFADHQLVGNDVVQATLLEKVRQSRTMVLFLSGSYLKSRWCRLEVGEFLERERPSKNKESVFIVELEPIDRSRLHPRLQELTPVRFWDRNALSQIPFRYGDPRPMLTEESPYWRQLNELAHMIADHLDRDQARAIAPAQPPLSSESDAKHKPRGVPEAQPRVTIWIAEPTEGLLGRWESLAAAVRQQGWRVRPEDPRRYSAIPQRPFAGAVEGDLFGTDLQVQLLEEAGAEQLGEADQNRVLVQATLARAYSQTAGTHFLQWRQPDSRLEAVLVPADPYRVELLGAIACRFEEFRQQVVTSQRQPLAGAAVNGLRGGLAPVLTALTTHASLSICVSVTQADQALGQEVAAMIRDLGADVLAIPNPDPTQSPADFHALLDEVFGSSEGVVIVYGSSSPAWALAQFSRARKLLAGRRRGIWGALVDGPPPEKTHHGILSSSLMTLDCRQGLKVELLESFVNTLRGYSRA